MNWSNTPFTPEEVAHPDGASYYGAVMRVLNNFDLRFPIGDKPNKSGAPLGFYRDLVAKKKKWSMTGREYRGGSNEDYSERHLSQTVRQFYDEIDAVAKELGVPMSKISKAINTARLGKRETEILAAEKQKEKRWKEVWQLLIPIYSELRRRGYSKQDLTG